MKGKFLGRDASEWRRISASFSYNLPPHFDREDVLQEVMIASWLERDSGQWAPHLSRNRVVNELRKLNRARKDRGLWSWGFRSFSGAKYEQANAHFLACFADAYGRCGPEGRRFLDAVVASGKRSTKGAWSAKSARKAIARVREEVL